MRIDLPYQILDRVWAVLETFDRSLDYCEACDTSSKKVTHTRAVQECVIDSIDISVDREKPLRFHYRVVFDEGTSGGAYAVDEVWPTEQLAQKAFAERYLHVSPYVRERPE